MDKQCNIARDLMPLVIDEAASEDSVRFVENHTAQCSECAAFYQGMQAMLPRTAETAGEKKRFSQAARKLRTRRWKRLLAWVCAGVLLTLLLLVGYQFARYQLTEVLETSMALGDYDLLLSAQENGKCVVTIRQAAPNIESGLSIQFVPENGGMTAYFNLNTAIIPRSIPTWRQNAEWYRGLSWDEEGLYYLSSGVRMPVLKVCKGTPENSESIYLHGNSIAPASGAMEEFFVLRDEYERMRDFPTEDEWNSPGFNRRLDEQYSLSETLRNLVPEWSCIVKVPDSVFAYVTLTPVHTPDAAQATEPVSMVEATPAPQG